MSIHDHEIKHLSELDRRKFLQVSAAFSSLTLLNALGIATASAATSVKLPGFSAFSKSVKVTKSGNYYLVESNGFPNHNMMVGIKSWQQQVPTIQNYTGANSWSIPVKPEISKNPMSAKDHFLRGAIALAVNGVPIFNALNNRGEDALLVGELDDWGGHCGRADDYHYHTAPLHLQTILGKKVPIAYALDGFPIYGETEIDGKAVTGLDSYNGHFDSKKVKEIQGQVDPQPSAKPFRPAGEPLRGAKITNLTRTGESDFDLTYSLNSSDYHVKYTATQTNVDIQFIDSTGTIRKESYVRR